MFNTVLNTTLELHARDHLPIQAKKFFAENVFRYIHCRYYIRKLFLYDSGLRDEKVLSLKKRKAMFRIIHFLYISNLFL